MFASSRERCGAAVSFPALAAVYRRIRNRSTPNETIIMDNIPDRTTIRAALLNLYSDSRFRKMWDADFLFVAHDFHGIKVGAIIATSNRPRYQEFLLNNLEFERLIAAVQSGKIEEAYVVNVIFNGADKTCVEVADATKLGPKLAGITTRTGRLGEFWTAPIFTDAEEVF